MYLVINENVFIISRIILFFVATYFVFRALQAVDFSKVFRRNSTDQIRFIFMVISVILGYLFVEAIMSLFENLNTFL